MFEQACARHVYLEGRHFRLGKEGKKPVVFYVMQPFAGICLLFHLADTFHRAP